MMSLTDVILQLLKFWLKLRIFVKDVSDDAVEFVSLRIHDGYQLDKYLQFYQNRKCKEIKIIVGSNQLEQTFKIKFIRDMSDNEYETPSKAVEDNQQGTALKSQDPGLVESKYEQAPPSNQNNQLDQIEKEIQQCGRRLQDIRLQMAKQVDKYSEKSLELEQERNNLRKRVMDLDYQHKVLCSEMIKQSKQKEAQEREKIIQEAEQKRQQRKRELQEMLERSRQKRQQEEEKIKSGSNEQPQEKEQKQQEGENNQSAKRQARIVQIEKELAESRLRRSRISRLNAQLDYLRSSYLVPRYLYPYPYWRDYYTPYAYPYTSPYLGYRWWL